jgi:hypothetical protein
LLARAIAREVFARYPRKEDVGNRNVMLAEKLERFGLSWELNTEVVDAVMEGSAKRAESAILESAERPVGVDVATIILIIKLILALFDWWMQNSVFKPSIVPLPGEPGAFDIDESIEIRV